MATYGNAHAALAGCERIVSDVTAAAIPIGAVQQAADVGSASMDSHQRKRRCLENTSTAQEVGNSVLREARVVQEHLVAGEPVAAPLWGQQLQQQLQQQSQQLQQQSLQLMSQGTSYVPRSQDLIGVLRYSVVLDFF